MKEKRQTYKTKLYMLLGVECGILFFILMLYSLEAKRYICAPIITEAGHYVPELFFRWCYYLTPIMVVTLHYMKVIYEDVVFSCKLGVKCFIHCVLMTHILVLGIKMAFRHWSFLLLSLIGILLYVVYACKRKAYISEAVSEDISMAFILNKLLHAAECGLMVLGILYILFSQAYNLYAKNVGYKVRAEEQAVLEEYPEFEAYSMEQKMKYAKTILANECMHLGIDEEITLVLGENEPFQGYYAPDQQRIVISREAMRQMDTEGMNQLLMHEAFHVFQNYKLKAEGSSLSNSEKQMVDILKKELVGEYIPELQLLTDRYTDKYQEVYYSFTEWSARHFAEKRCSFYEGRGKEEENVESIPEMVLLWKKEIESLE